MTSPISKSASSSYGIEGAHKVIKIYSLRSRIFVVVDFFLLQNFDPSSYSNKLFKYLKLQVILKLMSMTKQIIIRYLTNY